MNRKTPDLKKYMKDYCAVAVYIHVLMLKGYRFDERSFQNVAFQKKVSSLKELHEFAKHVFSCDECLKFTLLCYRQVKHLWAGH